MKKKIPLIVAAVCLTVVLAVVLLVFFLKKPADTKTNSKKVLETCPFELSDNAEWRFYPSDNLMGIAALAQDYEGADKAYILVFTHSPKQIGVDNVILNGTMDCICYSEFYEFDNQEIIDCGDLYYMKMKCDKRIVVMRFGFNLESGDIREYVSVDFSDQHSDPVMDVRYSRFDYSLPQKTKNIRLAQHFNEETGRWEDVVDLMETSSSEDSDYVKWTELQVVEENERSATRGEVTIGVDSYGYNQGGYDVNKEPKWIYITTLTLFVYTPSDAGIEGVEGFDVNNIRTENIRLYVKEGSAYVDITPGDFYLETKASNTRRVGDSDVFVEEYREIDLNSTELGELGEHDYRLVIEGYIIDFTLEVQTFEVW